MVEEIERPGWFVRTFKKKNLERYEQIISKMLEPVSSGVGLIPAETISEVVKNGIFANKLNIKDVQMLHYTNLQDAFEKAVYSGYSLAIDKCLSAVTSEFMLPSQTLDFLKMKTLEVDLLECVSDKRLTDEEMSRLDEKAAQLFVQKPIIEALLANHAQKVLPARYMAQIDNGILPTVECNSIVMQKNEVAHLIVSSAQFLEEKVKISYEGRSSGYSVRIAKGLTYRVGATKGRRIETPYTAVTDFGNLIITNKRIIFSGAKKNQVNLFKNIINIEPFSDGLKVSVSNRQKVGFYRYSEDMGDLVALLISKIVQNTEV